MSQEKRVERRGNILQMDSSRCIGCFACETACKMEHGFPAEIHPIRGMMIGPLEQNGEFVLSFVPTTCSHCENPACVAVCPSGAMQKRDDGIVFSDLELCIGCQTCAVACPFGVPQLNPQTGKIAKCDGCKDRCADGLWPVCALRCPTGALIYGTPSRVVQDIRHKGALRVAGRVLSFEQGKK